MGTGTALYIHIPFCTQKCRYCGFYSEEVSEHDPGRVVNAIIKEMKSYEPIGVVSTAYIGGGSPTCLPAKELLRLVKEIAAGFNTAAEFTVEVNPSQADEMLLAELRKLKVNRLSVGAQSFNQSELDLLGRDHRPEDIENAVVAARKAGYDNIGLDLIFAIPGSRKDFLLRSLRSAFYLGPRHISAYSLSYERDTPLQADRDAGKIVPVDEETDRRQYEFVIDECSRAGFEQYEISNFARGGFTCEHNLNYWANRPYIGIGPSAGSYYNGKRTKNIADISKYVSAIENNQSPIIETQTPDDKQIVCETAVLNLRRTEGIVLEDFKAQTGCDAMVVFAEAIEKYHRLGLLDIAKGRVFLARRALPIADSVLCDFATVD